ncbi:MAG: hypothetical protein KJ709_00790 [Nanoarchaeota archaeon]|nr:hypothetical protein [Nanoarchaeota archaeon]
MVQIIGSVLTATAGHKAYVGKAMDRVAVTFLKGTLTWYSPEEEVERIRQENSTKVITNQEFVFSIADRYMREIKGFIAFSDKIPKTDFSRLDDKELWRMYDRYCRLYEKTYIWSEPLFWVIKEPVSEFLEKYLRSKTDNVSHALAVLTAPDKKTFAAEEQLSLLKIAMKIETDEELRELFKKDLAIIEKNITRFKVNGDIDKHTEDFTWMPYDYGVMLWDKRHFLKELKRVLKKDAHIEIARIDDYYKTLRKEKRKLIKELGIDERHQKIFETMAVGAFIMDYKKGIYTKSHYQIIPMVQEIASRLGLTELQTRFMLVGEVKQALVEGRKPDTEVLDQRYELSLYFIDGKGKHTFADKVEAEEFVKAREEALDETSTVVGKTGSPGKYTGNVRVITDAREIHKVNKGEVLVTIMTSPDFTVGMRKAGAIVTDEGGITCHAAIISRELGIPCIIGTRIATRALKTGDMVEVDADKGTVKKVI